MEQAKARPKTAARTSGRVRDKLKLFSVRAGIDLPFLTIVLVLLAIGLVMLFSASYAYALAYYGNSYHFFKNQLVWAIVGIAAMIFCSYFDYHKFHKLAIPFLVLSYLLLALVLFMPARNGAHRWISIGGVGFQPSEITKFALVTAYAHFMSISYQKMNKFSTGILPYLVIFGSSAALLIKEPHLSCTVIIFALTCFMMFVGGVRARWFIIAFAVIGVLAYIALFTDLIPYASSRIDVWKDPFGYPDRDASHQTRQSLYAIGSGGFLGLGIGNSRQKYLYLPEPQNDFIFAVVCEELGFVGALVIIVLFALLVWRGMVISLRAPDKFGTLLGMGLTAQVGLQAVLNIAVVTNTVPNTGISLPFFSYGGSSLVMLMAQMGIVLSISRSARMEKS